MKQSVQVYLVQRVLVVVGLLIGIVLGIATRVGIFQTLNLQIAHVFQAAQPMWLVQVNRVISSLEIEVVVLVIPLFFYLQRKGEKKAAVFMIAAGISWFLMRLLKTAFGIPCPTVSDMQLLYAFHNIESSVTTLSKAVRFFDPDVCYPSGHVFDFTMVWGTVFLIRDRITSNKRLQSIIAATAGVLILLIGQSRISLGAHWFTDVIGGYAFGFAWLLLLKIILFSDKKQVGG